MKALALALVLAYVPRALAADDVPVVLKAGDPAPVAGVLLPDALAVLRAQEQAGCRVERDALKVTVVEQHKGTVSVPLVVLLVVLSVGAGAAVTAGGLAAAGKLK